MRRFFAEMHQTAVISCMELVLMRFGNTKYHLTVSKLRSYDTTISESYNHTEYLKMVLKEVYGNDYDQIINEIKMYLGDLAEQQDVAEFFKSMEN